MMDNVDREMLLGYLMNALEEDEITQIERELLRQPNLRTELASLQKELSPLTCLYESVDPPRNLARRTCDRIWSVVDKEEQVGDFLAAPEHPTRIVSISISKHQSPIVSLPDALGHFPESPKTESPKTVSPVHAESLQEILAVSSPSSQAVLPQSAPAQTALKKSPDRRLVRRNAPSLRKTEHSGAAEKQEAPRSRETGKRRRVVDILVSASIGILIAVIAFPAVNFARNRAQYLVAQSKIKELHQHVGVYSQLQDGDRDEQNGVNLAHSGWQEVVPNELPVLLVGNDSRVDVSPVQEVADSTASPLMHFRPVSGHERVLDEESGRDVILAQAPDDWDRDDLDPRGLAYQTLLSNVGQIVPLDPNGSTVHTAFGQNVLFQNGRVFFRVLPVFSNSSVDREQEFPSFEK